MEAVLRETSQNASQVQHFIYLSLLENGYDRDQLSSLSLSSRSHSPLGELPSI